MLTREQKKEIINDLSQSLKSAKGVVFSDFQGLPAKDVQELRLQLHKEGVGYKVVKITLLKRILKQIGMDTTGFNFQVPLSVSFSSDDEAVPAKILGAFAKTHEQLKLLGGILDAKFIDSTSVKSLAALPGKQELLGQLVGTIASPLRGLISVLSGNMRQLITVLSQIKN